MRVGHRSEIGHVRHRNEDAWLVPHVDDTLEAASPVAVAVADGMGGHPAGDVASRIAIDVLTGELKASSYDEPESVLVRALEAAHRAVAGDAAAVPEHAGMGTTAVVAIASPAAAWVAHVGDSRAYLLHDGEAYPLTRDHTERGFLVQALGLGRVIEPDVVEVPLAAGDRLLLCSDGLSGLLPDGVLGPLGADGDPQQACAALVDAALTAGGYDNVTVVIVEA